MTALVSVQKVIQWALSESGPPPMGDADSPLQLLEESRQIMGGIARLAAVRSARLRLGNPPLGDGGEMGRDTGLLALLLAVLPMPRLVDALLEQLPDSQTPWDWVARDALLSPALPHLPAGLHDRFLALSPLTALFYHPAPGQEPQAMRLCHRLIAHPMGRACLVHQLALPATVPETLFWRRDLLNGLRREGEAGAMLVLDVHETALLHNRKRHLAMVREAMTILKGIQEGGEESVLRRARAVAVWWEPLWGVRRDYPKAYKKRRLLDEGCLKGFELVQLARKLLGDFS